MGTAKSPVTTSAIVAPAAFGQSRTRWGPLGPYLVKAPDNSGGYRRQRWFSGIHAGIRRDLQANDHAVS